MVDRPPPSRLSVVERDGRLVVVDRKTGKTPPSAAERMAEHDRRRGYEIERPPLPEPASEVLVEPAPPPKKIAAPATSVRAAKREADAAAQKRQAAMRSGNKPNPWGQQPPRKQTEPSRKPDSDTARARIPTSPPASPSPGRKTIVTGKWWDEKGPRTIELGPKGQQVLSGGFVTLAIVATVFAVTLLLIQPVLLFIVAFLAFQFGGKAFAPLGASIVDKALAERH